MSSASTVRDHLAHLEKKGLIRRDPTKPRAIEILDGDYVIVRQQPTANNRDIVVAMTAEDEATVKTFYKERNHIRMQPEKPTMGPILLPAVTILSKVIRGYRNIH